MDDPLPVIEYSRTSVFRKISSAFDVFLKTIRMKMIRTNFRTFVHFEVRIESSDFVKPNFASFTIGRKPVVNFINVKRMNFLQTTCQRKFAHFQFFLMLFNFEFDVTVFDVPVFDITLLYPIDIPKILNATKDLLEGTQFNRGDSLSLFVFYL